MKILKEESIGDLVAHGYTVFGKYVNTKRVLPLLYDGLKPSYRRAIYSCFEIDKSYSVTQEMLGWMMKYHPHNTEGSIKAVSQLCHYGILDGYGNHGRQDILGDHDSPAAPRYTKVKVNDKIRNMISKVIKYVPHHEDEVSGKYMEPDYIPTPIPLSLTFDRLQGLGIGVSTLLPSFSMESLYQAYIKNDYNLLKYRGDLEIDYDSSNLEGLWIRGYGHVTYKYKITSGARWVMIDGSPSRFSIKHYDE
jgi:DNA gyrase/topoisomerase IV subunit A